ncbi:hypothetical protein FRACYDRAFT_238390 [Fragilariopsis cylindrus CCMP1102]|uniref:Uncharacterized protein n=1 Tax=Fragilariopsis cylindrus CCMP1102 TaxID=635003 RepID=A0A1E7FIF3_9STRA|nr:hypothetical protein FRACYDRAFT_238390 [Fragilariopsis cylindrus CCMP1102]|eukprot:OEU17959.1 hypothetical protein FRACYDRAFT_238390 [Fragilariopsis cylindrus CCMP1102]
MKSNTIVNTPTSIDDITYCYKRLRESDPGEEEVTISKLDNEDLLYMTDFLEYYSVYSEDISHIPWWLILVQDYTEDIYDESLFIKQWKIVDDMYNGFGTHIPANGFLGPNFAGYYGPKPQPIPPLGNPNVNGITAGNIQDSGTPFKWTQ